MPWSRSMDPSQRARFNANFTPDKYAALLRAVNEREIWPVDFRISETPIFLTPEFTEEITTCRARVDRAGANAGIPRARAGRDPAQAGRA